MKKSTILIFILVLTFVTGSAKSYAATSYFTNNKALDSIFKKMEKEFLSYKKDEIIYPEYFELVLDEGDKKKAKPWPTKKITDKQVKAAAQKKLNEIKTDIEIREERLGGLTKQDYKLIEDKLERMLLLSKNSDYGWDLKGKNVNLYLTGGYDEAWLFYGDLKGKFQEMGKEKDSVNQSKWQVKNQIIRYLNQSKEKGNKINSDIYSKLPGKVEELFKEREVSVIIAARSLSDIHDSIFNPDWEKYDGTDSIEDIIDHYDSIINSNERERGEEKRIEYYQYPKDAPSPKVKADITRRILNDELPNTFTYGFSKGITTKELAQLYFWDKELDEKIVIADNIIKKDSPDYVKNAFIYGMIDDESDLNKSLTRLEATRKLVKGLVYRNGGVSSTLQISDNTKIPLDDQRTVSTCIMNGMRTRANKFEPQSKYTKEEAILDSNLANFNLRGYNIPLSLREPKKIVVGKNTINLLFESNDEIEEYMEDYFDYTVLDGIKLTGKYTKVDSGGLLIELFTAEKGIKFTIKKGVTYLDFNRETYGPELQYKIEPKVVKTSDKVNMTIQPDSIYKKLYKKLDAILAKIIKSSMTQEQKVKAIHDFVVKHITYDSRLQDEQTIESVIKTIDEGRGVCGDYTLLFLHLCRRASIPCVYEAGSYITLNHAWNAVYLNGKWLFVDTTWDDGDNGQILYKYYLKDKYTFMKTHTPFMGVPDIDLYTDIDNMKIKTQDELRAYLLQNIYWVDGYKLSFRMADKKMKPFIDYMRDPDVTITLKYDSKKDLYTLYVKGKK